MDLAGWVILAVAALTVAWMVLRLRSRRSRSSGLAMTPTEIEAAIQTALTVHRRPEPERVDLRKPLPDGYVRLIQGQDIEIVGESRYRPMIEGHVGQRPEGHWVITDAALIAERDNVYDPNAVAVQIGGATVGYLNRDDAVSYRPVMDACRERGIVPTVRADVRGGWHKEDGSWADFGITLFVAPPEKILDRWRSERAPR